jgi:hypothetical protein
VKPLECEECGEAAAEYAGTTDDDRTKLRCTTCGFHWTHGPSAEDLKAGKTGGSKFFCPVCPHIFADQSAPILTIGTPSMAGHRCDHTKSFLLGHTYGASAEKLDARLREVSDEDLAGWPRVLEMKHERVG